ncbi:MAG TPA: HEAT repeat domain-containing protein [Planctomycetota bacterium]|nr:HEAT repeat domain-containing protein [Planctomycetota bacterium]
MDDTPAKLTARNSGPAAASHAAQRPEPASQPEPMPGIEQLIGLRASGWAAVLLGSGLLHLIAFLIFSQWVVISQPCAQQANVLVDIRGRPEKGPSLQEQLLMELQRQERKRPIEVEPRPQPHVEQQAPPKETTDPGRGAVSVDVPSIVPMRTLGLGPVKTSAGLGGLRDRANAESRVGAVKRYGGTEDSEEGVKAALEWLRRHQKTDGGWSCGGFRSMCDRGSLCSGAGTIAGIDPGITGLALLAFLSGGNCPGDRSEYGDVVGRAINHLLAIQHPSGRFGGPSGHEMYNHSIATLALAEACILSEDVRLREPLERAVKHIANAQQPGGGWDYTSVRTGRNDTSITGFAVMALKSAHAARIEVPWMVTYRVIEHFDRMTKPNGEVIYADIGVGTGRAGQGMVAVGAVSRQFLGWPVESDVLRKQYAILAQHLPQWEMLSVNNFHTMYYWYYGTLAMFQAGGKYWELWNASLRDMLIRNQRKDGCARGSWDPAEMWLGKAAGRIYSTAMNAMNLQIYYRYLPMYQEAASLNSVEALLRASETQGEMRIRAIRLLAEFQGQQSRKSLLAALNDRDNYVRLIAARSLVERKDADAALPVLVELSRNENGFVRSGAVEELLRLDTLEIVPVLIERLGDDQGFVAERAADKLRKLCRQNIAFDPDAGPEQRDLTIAAWRDWWVQYSAGKVKIDPSVIIGSISNLGENGSVILDVGGRDGVKTGDDFEVFRYGKPIALLNVHRVAEPFSIARVRQLDGDGVRKGDVIQRKARN